MLEIVVDSIPNYVYWKDPELNYLGCNKSFAKLNDLLDTSSIIGKKDKELPWARLNPIHLRNKDREVLTSKKAQKNIIETWKSSNGEEILYRTNRIPIIDDDGKLMGILVSYEDITERKRSQQRIKESEMKYRNILDNLKAGYFEVDLKGNFTYINKYFLDVSEYAEEDFIGKNYISFINKQTSKKIFECFNNVYKSKSVISDEIFELYTKSKKKLYFESTIYLRYKNDKKIGFSGVFRNITERYVLEKKLKKTEEKHKLISENANDLICIVNEKGIYEYVNEETHYKIMGYTQEEMVGNSLIDYIHPDDKKKAIDALLKGKEKGEASVDLRVQHKQNKWIWVSVKGKTFIDNDNRLKGIIISRDISERRRAEILLKQSEEKYRRLFQGSPYAIFLVNFKGFVLDCNPKAVEFLKTPKDQIIGGNYVSLLSLFNNAQKNIAFFEPHLEIMREKEEVPTLEYKLIRKDGTESWVNIKSTKLQWGKENMFQTVVQDITEKKRAEINLKRSEEKLKLLNKELEQKILERTRELKNSEENYKNMVNDLDVGFFKGELGGKLLIHNNAFKNILEISDSDNLLGVHSSKFFLNTDDREKYYKELTKNGSVKNFRAPIKTLKNKTIYTEINAHIVDTKSNETPIVEGTFLDITEKHRLEKQLRESEKKLRAQNIELKMLDQMKNDFITIAAHELKTPLISIGGYTDFILTKYKDLDSEIKDDLMRVQNNVSRLHSYIEELLDVIKIDAKKMEIELTRKNIHEIVKGCISDLDFQLKDKNLHIDLNVDKYLTLYVDPSRINQVFSNLIVNAIKFTPENGKIEISNEIRDGKCVFEIRDTGRGLTENEISSLFQKFVRFNNEKGGSAFESGTGLGLFITKGIVEAHGGKIWAKSKGKDKGSEFYFTIPLIHH
ncbi:MAG: PAS domain S-box protein [Candidatus Lokiarchaeota archaeon]|nr:PAS domain S-box protein [Candidatus Lokiarchaeota archaeon]